MNNKVTLLFSLFVCFASATDSWSVLSKDIMTICMGIHMESRDVGEVSGMQNVVGAEIKRTTDAGLNWTVQYREEGLEMYMCLAFDQDNDCGVTAGLGFDMAGVSSLYTTDGGLTWNTTDDLNLVAAYQDCEPVPGDDDMFIMPGTWENLGNSGWGVSISHNKGKDFDHYDWGFDTEPRYASFADTNVGWISGGYWPEDSLDSKFHRRFTKHVGILEDSEGVLREMYVPTTEVGDYDGYVGILAKTSDGGKTWALQDNDTGRLYFNEIYAATENDVWAVGEGPDGAWVIHTSDGGNTWEDQYFESGASMMTVKFFDTLEGWIGGMAAGRGLDGGLWHTLDGGETWELFEMKGYYITNLDLLDSDHVYATAFDSAGVSALLEYIPDAS